jgi:peroxiredoxin
MLLAALTLAGCDTSSETLAGETPGPASPAGFPRVDFTLPDLDGQPRSLSEWDGDMVVLNFWATWCPPCKKEMPLFQQRYEAHAADGFTIVAVAVDEVEETRDFVLTFGIEFPVLIGQEDAIVAGRAYGNRIGALPYSVVIDRQGMVRETHRGEVTENDLDAWLESYL